MNNFTILPNNLFYTKKEDDSKSIFKLTNNHKTLLVLDYLHINTNRIGITKFTIEDIITTYGFTPKRGKNNINEQIKHILILLQKHNIIELIDDDIDLENVNINKLISCKYNGIKKNDNGDNIEFTTIDYDKFMEILNYDDDRVDNIKLLFYYCYLSCKMYKRIKGQDVNKDGGRAEVCFPSYENITDNINIKSDTIKQYNDILVKMNLIRIGNLGLYYYADDKNKLTHESPNFYTTKIDKRDLKEGVEDKNTSWYSNLHEAMKAYKNANDDKVFLNTREYKSDKPISNFIARINKLEELGKAKKEYIEKRDSYIESKKMDTSISSLKSEIIEKWKIINEKYDKHNLQLDICENWEDYLPSENEMIDWEQKVYSVTDYKNILKEITKIEIKVDNLIYNVDWGEPED